MCIKTPTKFLSQNHTNLECFATIQKQFYLIYNLCRLDKIVSSLQIITIVTIYVDEMKLVDNYRHILCGLAVVLQDDGDVHVDDDEEADHEVRQQEGDGHDGVPAVPLVARLGIS